jgi:hypothetical protein
MDPLSLTRFWIDKTSSLSRFADSALLSTPRRAKLVLNCVTQHCIILYFGDYCCIQFETQSFVDYSFAALVTYNVGDKFKDDELDCTCSKQGEVEKFTLTVSEET